MKKKLNKKELSKLLSDNLAYYVANPDGKRCINVNLECRYSGKSIGKNTMGCFVGRLLPSKMRLVIDNNETTISVDSLVNTNKYNLPKYMVDNPYMMKQFQILHDENSYWTSTGLSDFGKIELSNILKTYKDILDEKYFQKFL